MSKSSIEKILMVITFGTLLQPLWTESCIIKSIQFFAIKNCTGYKYFINFFSTNGMSLLELTQLCFLFLFLDGPTSPCPTDAAACHLSSTDSTVGDNVGKAKKHLIWLNDHHLQLRYESDVSPQRCNGFKPRVTVAFVCPQDEGRLSGVSLGT